jgi:putative sigma-54 modulation protein
MRLELRGHHVDITPGLRRLVDAKLSKLERLLNDRALSALAILTLEKHRHRTEITLHARGENFLHGVGDTGSWETSISAAIDKISQQAKKLKTRLQDKRRGAKMAPAPPVAPVGRVEKDDAGKRAAAPRPAPRARMPRILRASRQAIKPMSVSDAAREVEAGDGLVVFRDIDTQTISVLYRRPGGELALVETEA